MQYAYLSKFSAFKIDIRHNLFILLILFYVYLLISILNKLNK